jgi:hypothetical protein
MIVFGFVAAAFLAGWIASFVTRRRARSSRPDEAPSIAEEVEQALRSDAANEGMLSVVRAERDASLSELELDLADWGFTYGVAWARARERAPGGPDDDIVQEALEAAEQVFRAYTDGDDWTQRAVENRANGGSTEPSA